MMVHKRGVGCVETIHGRGDDSSRESGTLAAEIQTIHARLVCQAVSVEPDRAGDMRFSADHHA